MHEVVRKALLLRVSPLFRSLDEQTLLSIAETATAQRFAAGEPLVTPGAEGDSVFVIANGRVKVGYQQGSVELGTGEIIGELAAIDGGRRGSAVAALEPVETLCISRDDFLDLLADQPALVRQVAAMLAALGGQRVNRRAFAVGVAYVAVTSMAGVAARAYTDAAFLNAYGVKYLPHFFIVLALASAGMTAAYDVLARRMHAQILDVGLILALGGTGVVALKTPDVRGSGAIFAIALVIAGLSALANLAAWNALTTTVSGRDARRMLPRAGAAVTAGGVASGFGSSAFIAKFGLTNLPLVAILLAVAMLACALILPRMVAVAASGAKAASQPTVGVTGQPAISVAVPPARTLAAEALGLVKWLVVVAFIESALNSLVEFQFKVAANGAYSADRLGVALAALAGFTNAVLLLLQLVAAPRLLVSRSLPFTLSVHPTLLMGALGVLFLRPGFAAATAARAVDSIFRGATGRTGQEVSLSALAPGDRSRWKILLRGVVTPLGSATAGGALLALGVGVAGVPVLAALVVTLFLLQRRAARAYLGTLAAPLGMTRVALTDEIATVRALDLDQLHELIDLSGTGDETQATLARALLGRSGHRADELAPHLAHDEAPVRAALFAMAARRPHPAATGEIRAAVAIEQDDQALAAGLRALAAHGDASAADRARDLAADGTGRPARAASAYMAELGLLSAEATRAAVVSTLDFDGAWAADILRAAGITMDLAERMASADAHVRREAFRCAVGSHTALADWLRALGAGDVEAQGALKETARWDAPSMIAAAGVVSASTRARLARALRDSTDDAAEIVLDELLADADDAVREAAARAIAKRLREGRRGPATGIVERALEREMDRFGVYLDARGGNGFFAEELAVHTRRALERVLGIAALEGNAPKIRAAGRRLHAPTELERRRALDLLQEVMSARPRLLALVERYLARVPAHAAPEAAVGAACALDPWLARAAQGELSHVRVLRESRLFADVPGPALAELAERSVELSVAAGERLGEAMFFVLEGTLREEDGPLLQKGGSAGERDLISERGERLVAVTAARVLRVARDDFQELAGGNADLGLGLLGVLVAELRSVKNRARVGVGEAT